jgi:rod shape determining protein RodA
VGIVTMWSFQLLQNVGMCIGLMPITGIPLPFISFGSSSMIAQLMSVGMVQSIWRHRPKAA